MMSRLFLVLALIGAVGAGAAAFWWYPGGRSSDVAENPPQQAILPDAKIRPKAPRPPAPAELPPGVEVRFREVTDAAGIHFEHFNGATDMNYIMETMGSGLAWIDYDQDGLLDLFLVQGSTVVPPAPA